jgi:uncharacterized RDD family membrane protein YckC
MAAVDLRIAGSDGAEASRARLLIRAVVLAAAVGALWWIEPLLVAYPLWMLFNDKHQLAHDQVSDTVVVRRAAPIATPRAVDNARAQLDALEPPEAKVLLGDLDQLRLHARAKVRTASLPIFILGLLALGGMLANWLVNVVEEYYTLGHYFWALAAPIGLAVTAWWFGRQQRVLGAGTRVGPMVVITSLVACAALVTAPYSLWAHHRGGLVVFRRERVR